MREDSTHTQTRVYTHVRMHVHMRAYDMRYESTRGADKLHLFGTQTEFGQRSFFYKGA